MEDGPRPTVEAAAADRATDLGWEPADWDAMLRKRRRDFVADTWLFIALLWGAPFAGAALENRPPRLVVLVVVALWTSLLLYQLHRTSTPSGRRQWAETTKEEIRVERALRHHVSIGAADREFVTERADAIDSWAPAHFVGWPLLAVLAIAAIVDPTVSGSDRIVFWLFVLFSVVQLLLACRRVREARRWLDDPLPRP